jgi:alpha-L-arabinofuranosidase
MEQVEWRTGKQPKSSTWRIAVKKISLWVLCLCFGTVLHGQVTVLQPIPQLATIDVNGGSTAGATIPRTLFGTFLEPIGDSTYNGLWAELLQNPSFEAGLWSPARVADMLRDNPELVQSSRLALPLPWEPLDPRQGNRYELNHGEAANSWQSLRVFGVPGEPTGVKQKIYLPIHRTREYTGSLYARHLSGATHITVSVRLRDQREVLTSRQLEAAATTWTKYPFTLQIPEGKLHRLDPADFVIEVEEDERVELDQVSLMPTDAIGGLDPDVVALAKEMKTPLVRFGGNFTSSYHWMDGIGPRDKRKNEINLSWGIPEYNTFGTDEFLEFCRQIGAQPQIALNLGSGTPEEAEAWVRYVNGHWSPPSALLWELGNELWGNWNLGYPTRWQLAARTAAFSRAVHAVDPSARLIATGADPDHFDTWNKIELSNPSDTFNYLSTHFVVRTNEVVMSNPTPDFVSAAAVALPVELGRKLHDIQNQVDATPDYMGKVHIAFTEWLFSGNQYGAPNFTNVGGAVVAGGFLNMLMRNAAIVPVSDMTGIMEFAGIWKKRSQAYGTPTYYVFRMYASANAANPVAVTVNAGLYSVHNGVRRLPEIDAVPYLDVVATLSQNGSEMTLFCVNRSLFTDIATRIRLHDFAARPTADVHLVNSRFLTDSNDEVNPTRVREVDSKETIEPQAWTHTFPHASVTVIVLHHS